MRVLCCLLLGSSVLLSGCGDPKEDAGAPSTKSSYWKNAPTVRLDTIDKEPKTTKESKEAAVAAIKKLGGFVSFEENNPGKPVVHVSLFGQDVTDASLGHLKELTSLTSLDLVNTRVTEAGLEHLKGLTPNVRSRGAENSV